MPQLINTRWTVNLKLKVTSIDDIIVQIFRIDNMLFST